MFHTNLLIYASSNLIGKYIDYYILDYESTKYEALVCFPGMRNKSMNNVHVEIRRF